MKSTFWTRLPVTVLGIPAIIYLLYTGGVSFAVFVTLAVLLSLNEFYRLKITKGPKPIVWVGFIMGILICSFYYHYPHLNRFSMGAIFLILIVISLFIELFSGKKNPLENISVTFGGIVYVAGLLGTMIALRNWDTLNGSHFTMAMILTVWICDSCAYSFGKLWGKKKLIERISPNKTTVGFVGGIVGSFISFYVMDIIGLIQYDISLLQILTLTFIVGICGQLGDFVESMFKRDAGVKDSGKFLLGHGGVLDRFDSLIFTSPLVFIFVSFL